MTFPDLHHHDVAVPHPINCSQEHYRVPAKNHHENHARHDRIHLVDSNPVPFDDGCLLPTAEYQLDRNLFVDGNPVQLQLGCQSNPVDYHRAPAGH